MLERLQVGHCLPQKKEEVSSSWSFIVRLIVLLRLTDRRQKSGWGVNFCPKKYELEMIWGISMAPDQPDMREPRKRLQPSVRLASFFSDTVFGKCLPGWSLEKGLELRRRSSARHSFEKDFVAEREYSGRTVCYSTNAKQMRSVSYHPGFKIHCCSAHIRNAELWNGPTKKKERFYFNTTFKQNKDKWQEIPLYGAKLGP